MTLRGSPLEPTEDLPTAAGPAGDDGTARADELSNLTVDFGFIAPPPLSLGNRVWLDDGSGGGSLNNGQQDGRTMTTRT